MNSTPRPKPDASIVTERTLARLRDVSSMLETAKRLRDHEARVARSEGHTLQAIADAAGLKSRGHVHTIVTADLGGDAA